MVMVSQTQTQSCPVCGRPLASAEPEGLCPACLARQVLVDAPDASVSETRPQQPLPGVRFFGDYELLEEIGRGGMGVVFKAQQLGLNRIIALKVLTGGAAAVREFVHRFHTEASAAASLSHPNIVPIYEFGEHEGAHFLAMRFMEGGTLQGRCYDRPAAVEAARLVVMIAEALEYAHRHGVLHRDLKPGNILIDNGGQPFIADFGLARVSAHESDLTISNAVLGTAPYLAPEVAARGAGAATTASDVYGLGAILYHLLAGRPPFTGATIGEVLRQVQETEPLAPSQVIPKAKADSGEPLGLPLEVVGKEQMRAKHASPSTRIPRDLEIICLKCLDKEPAKRYSTAQDFADDLNRFLRGEPILARPASATERVWRWCKRKPVVAGLVAALHLSFAAGLAGVLWQWHRAEWNAANEAHERRRAEAGELDARQRQYISDMNIFQQAWEEGNLKRAQALLLSHVPKPGAPDPRDFEWRYLWNLCRDESLYAFTNFDDYIGTLAFSPDGRTLAVGGGHVVKLLDFNSHNELGELRAADTNEWIRCLAFSPRSTNILATAGDAGVIRLWNLTTKEVTNFVEHLDRVSALAFSPDGNTLAVAGLYVPHVVSAWNLAEKRLLWTTNVDNPANALAFSPDGNVLVSGGGRGNGNALVWEVATGKELAPFPLLHKGWMSSLAFSSDGRTLATSASDGQLIIWDFAERRAKGQPIKRGGGSVAFSPDGRLVACIGVDLIARVWDVASHQLVALLRNLGPVLELAFTPDGTRILCTSEGNTVRVWDATGRTDKDTLAAHKSWVTQVAFSQDGRRLASVDFDLGVTKLWDVPTRRFITDLPGAEPHSGGGAAFSPDGKLLATSSYRGTVRLWDTTTFQRLRVLTNDFSAGSLAFSPNSKVLGLATGYMPSRTMQPRTLAFWDVASAQKLNRLTAAEPDASAVTFSKDGRLVGVGYFTGWVRLWDWKTGSNIAAFQKHLGEVPTVAFSTSGSMLTSGGEGDENVVIYGLAPPRILKVLEGHTGGVKSVAFAPDDKILAAAGNDGTIRLWNLATYQLVLTLKKHAGIVTSIAFTPKGNALASGGGDGDVRLWPAPSFEEITKFERAR